MVKIASSILSANFANLSREIHDIDAAGSDYIHIDVMDGHYVQNITFGSNIVKTIRPLTKKPLDVHLMIKPVEKFIADFVKAGANIISFHPEADSQPMKTIELIRSLNCKPGIAIHPNVEIDKIQSLVQLVDIVVVMTVVPGFGGQKFMEDQVSKISFLKKYKIQNNLNYEIEIDGGINKETAKICKKIGADVLVAGSSIFGSSNNKYKKIIEELRLVD